MLFIISTFAPLFCVWRWFCSKHIAKITEYWVYTKYFTKNIIYNLVKKCYIGINEWIRLSEIRLNIDNMEVVKFVYLFMYRFCIFHIPFFCVPKNPCCGFDSFFLSLFPNDC